VPPVVVTALFLHQAAIAERQAWSMLAVGQAFALFGHGGTNRIILLDAMGAPLACAFRIVQDFACVNIIDYHADGSHRVLLMNGTSAYPCEPA